MEKKTKPKTETINVYHLIGAIALGIAIVCLFTGSFLWALVLGVIGYTGIKKGHERFEEAFEREYRKLLAEQDQKPDPDEAPNEESPVQGPEPVRAEVPTPDEQKKRKRFINAGGSGRLPLSCYSAAVVRVQKRPNLPQNPPRISLPHWMPQKSWKTLPLRRQLS